MCSFGLSIAPADLRERAGVSNNPFLYICVIVANLAGAGGHQYLKRNTRCPGIYLAALSTVMMLIGDLGFSLHARSPWWALFFAPCFGALNALSSGPPLSVSVVTMTANSQKLPPYLYMMWDDRKWQPPPIGAILPLPALLGAGVSAGLLWVDHRRWVMSAWSTVPVIVGLAVTLVVHDALALRCKQCAQVHATRTPSPDARPVISV